MATTTKIQWTDHTFNPLIGCAKVHAGCANCYAEADFGIRRKRVEWGPDGTRSRTSDANWKEPLKWNNQQFVQCVGCGDRYDLPRGMEESFCQTCGDPEALATRPRVFCASLADVFEDWQGPIVDHKGMQLWHGEHHAQPRYVADDTGVMDRAATMDDLRADLFRLIDATPNLDWLLLTKRPENIRRMWIGQAGRNVDWPGRHKRRDNVWLGTSVSDQETADRMIPELLACRDLAAKLFVSYEPALGPVCFEPYLADPIDQPKAIQWLIVGGESGPNSRPCNVDWIRSSVEQCGDAGVACFVKQLGSYTVVDNAELALIADSTMNARPIPGVIHLNHPKGGDPSEWPEDLRVQEFPT